MFKEFARLNLDQYLNDRNTQLIIERLLEKVVGRVVDINYHILRNEYEIMPSDYRDSFFQISKNVKFDENFIQEISRMAGLRNALAHEYSDIDQVKVYESINKALTQVSVYLKKLLEFVS